MPRIPTITREIDPMIGPPQAHAEPWAFGASAGQELANVGSALIGLGGAFSGIGKGDQAKNDELAIASAVAGNSYAPRYNDQVTNYPEASGKGLAEHVGADANIWVDETYKKLIDGGMPKRQADQVKLRLLRTIPGYVETAANQERQTAVKYGITSLDSDLQTLENDIIASGRTDEKSFDETVKKMTDRINAVPGITAAEKAELIHSKKNDWAIARFERLMNDADTPEEIAALQKDLKSKYWTEALEPSNYQKTVNAVEAKRKALATFNPTSDATLNAIHADPSKYDTLVEEGVKALPKTGNVAVDAQVEKTFRSRAAANRFLGEATKDLEDDETPDPTKVQALLDELNDKKWRDAIDNDVYNQLVGQLISIKNQVNVNQNKIEADLTAATKAKQKARHDDFTADLNSAKERSNAGKVVSLEELNAINGKLGFLLTIPEGEEYGVTEQQIRDTKDLIIQQDQIRRANKMKPTGMMGEINKLRNGSKAIWKDSDNFRSYNGKTVVTRNIRDRTSTDGMTPEANNILRSMANGAAQFGIARIEVKAAHGGGHKSHMDGTEWDIVGYHADGSIWTPAERVAIARLAAQAGADRFGLYEGPRSSYTLHVGYSGRGPSGKFRPAAVWGALGLTGGDASRQFRDPASRQFMQEFYGGRVTVGKTRSAGGGPGGFLGTLVRLESGNQNIDSKLGGTSSGLASGYFQITSGTWKDFATPLGIDLNKYPTAKSAPYEVQKQVAMTIPLGRWAPDTIRGLRQAGYNLNLDKTLGENVAANGGDITDFEPSIDHEDFVRLQTTEQAYKVQQEALNTDAVSYDYSQRGQQPQVLINAARELWAQREGDYNRMKEQYELTQAQRQPFTTTEVAAIQNMMAANNHDDIMKLFRNIATWSPENQQEALRQIGKGNDFYGQVGRVAMTNPSIAAQAMYGHDRLAALSLSDVKLSWKNESEDFFGGLLNQAFRGQDPATIKGKRELYESLYAAQFGTQDAFDENKMQEIIEQTEDINFDVVNDMNTALPAGVTGADFETHMIEADWKAESLTGTAPLAQDPTDGGIKEIIGWAKETARPIAIGHGLYIFMDPNTGGFVKTRAEGEVRNYVMKVTPETVRQSVEKAAKRIVGPGDLSREPVVPEMATPPEVIPGSMEDIRRRNATPEVPPPEVKEPVTVLPKKPADFGGVDESTARSIIQQSRSSYYQYLIESGYSGSAAAEAADMYVKRQLEDLGLKPESKK